MKEEREGGAGGETNSVRNFGNVCFMGSNKRFSNNVLEAFVFGQNLTFSGIFVIGQELTFSGNLCL